MLRNGWKGEGGKANRYAALKGGEGWSKFCQKVRYVTVERSLILPHSLALSGNFQEVIIRWENNLFVYLKDFTDFFKTAFFILFDKFLFT